MARHLRNLVPSQLYATERVGSDVLHLRGARDRLAIRLARSNYLLTWNKGFARYELNGAGRNSELEIGNGTS